MADNYKYYEHEMTGHSGRPCYAYKYLLYLCLVRCLLPASPIEDFGLCIALGQRGDRLTRHYKPSNPKLCRHAFSAWS